MSTQSLTRLSIVCAALLALTACGGSEAAQESPAATVVSTAAPARPESTATQLPVQPAATSTQSAAAVPGEDRAKIPDIQANLDNLDSYRARYTFEFEGKDKDGKDRKAYMDFLQEAIVKTKEQRVRITTTGLDDKDTTESSIDFLTVGGVNYLYGLEDGVAKCASFSSDDPTSNPTTVFRPSDLFGGLEGLRLVERGVVLNGVKTDRYALDQTAVGLGIFEKASGEVWIAQEGGFVVRYAGTGTGKVTMFGGDEQGTAKWDYQLQAINNVDKIELPQECLAEKPADDIPVPASAKEKAQFGGLITFKSTETAAQVAEFYQTEMPKLGWKAGEAGSLGEMRTLTFTKADRSLNIIISPEEGGGVSVMITEKKGE
ncbi:MAG: hypothetical protein RMN25_06690 [Anaerolineae bacterium]|nr:hypothetical protein [Thermoflexales bacterium]MDW8407457.1 hypothetical protein [Anaerolineae bacterium]